MNTGENKALAIRVTSTGLPLGTTVTKGCTELAVGEVCNITVTPGKIASLNKISGKSCTTVVAPTPGVITIKATNSAAVKRGVLVLGYGCIYQGGFVYSINDTVTTKKPNTLSIRGNVLSPNKASIFLGKSWNQAKLICANLPVPPKTPKWSLPTICNMAPSIAASFSPRLTAACSLNKQQISKTLPFLIADSGMNNCTRGSYCFGGPYWSSTSANENMTSAGFAIFEKSGSWGEPTMVQGGFYGVRCSRPF